MDRRLINARELAEYLGTTPGGIYQRVSRREVPYVKIGGSIRFDLRSIDRWIEAQTVKPVDIEKRICV